MSFLSGTLAVARREFASFLATPLAYVFIVIFLVLNGVFTFLVGMWYERGQADLRVFFEFHPWLYLFLVAAMSMRLWSEERRGGTMELLLTLPLSLGQAVVGKFLAAWALIGVALLLTFPLWLTANYLGNPDNGVIVASYLGSWFMAGSILALGSAVSASTSNQVIAFIGSAVLGFVLVIIGVGSVTEALKDVVPAGVVDALAGLSLVEHFQAVAKGVIDLRDVVYFLTLMVAGLMCTAIIIDIKRA